MRALPQGLFSCQKTHPWILGNMSSLDLVIFGPFSSYLVIFGPFSYLVPGGSDQWFLIFISVLNSRWSMNVFFWIAGMSPTLCIIIRTARLYGSLVERRLVLCLPELLFRILVFVLGGISGF